MDSLRKIANKFPICKTIEEKTNGKFKVEYQVIIMILGIIGAIAVTPIGPLLTTMVGIIIPLKETLMLLGSVNPKSDELRNYLIFWLVISFFVILDAYFPIIISFIPFYHLGKLMMLVYIAIYKKRATEMIYDSFISKIPESWYSFSTPENLKDAAEAAKEALRMSKKQVEEMKKKE